MKSEIVFRSASASFRRRAKETTREKERMRSPHLALKFGGWKLDLRNKNLRSSTAQGVLDRARSPWTLFYFNMQTIKIGLRADVLHCIVLVLLLDTNTGRISAGQAGQEEVDRMFWFCVLCTEKKVPLRCCTTEPEVSDCYL